jgi:hypothetical protein
MSAPRQENEGLSGHGPGSLHGHAGDHSSASSHADSESDHGVMNEDDLGRCSTHHSMGPDAPVENRESTVEIPDEVYDRLPSHRKLIIVALLSFCSFLAPISSTSVLAATPEVAAEYHTTGSIINLSNAFYMLFMGLSPLFWGPLSQVYGRRPVSRSMAWRWDSGLTGRARLPSSPPSLSSPAASGRHLRQT